MKNGIASVITVVIMLLGFTISAKASNTEFVEVIANGYGTTVERAMKAAARSAVESVVGSFVDSSTHIKNDELIEDQILTYSPGLIVSSKIIGEPKKIEESIYSVKILAIVKKNEVKEKLKAIAPVSVKLDGTDLFMQMQSAQDNFKDAKQMIKDVLDKHISCVVVKDVPGKNGKGTLDFDPASGEVFANIEVSIDHAKYAQFVREIADKLGPMATKITRVMIKNYNYDGEKISFYCPIKGKDNKYSYLAVLQSARNGSAIIYEYDANKMEEIYKNMDNGSIAFSVVLNDKHGIEISRSETPINKRWSDSHNHASIFHCDSSHHTAAVWGFIVPFFSSGRLQAHHIGFGMEGFNRKTFRVLLGKFTAEELQNVGGLSITVGHIGEDRIFVEAK